MLSEVMIKFNIQGKELDMSAPNVLTKEVCESLNIPLIDLYTTFRTSAKFPFFQRDEHLNSIGHQIIADALKSAFVSESGKYELFSTGNKNERYPTFYDEGMSVLYQSQ